MTRVVAGILRRNECILICQRKADQPHALKWEFPGGKMEQDESPAQALERELNEELGIEAAAGEELLRYEFAYPGKNPLLLIFLEVLSFQGEPQNKIFKRITWSETAQMKNFDFLEGDSRFLEWLIGRR